MFLPTWLKLASATLLAPLIMGATAQGCSSPSSSTAKSGAAAAGTITAKVALSSEKGGYMDVTVIQPVEQWGEHTAEWPTYRVASVTLRVTLRDGSTVSLPYKVRFSPQYEDEVMFRVKIGSDWHSLKVSAEVEGYVPDGDGGWTLDRDVADDPVYAEPVEVPVIISGGAFGEEGPE